MTATPFTTTLHSRARPAPAPVLAPLPSWRELLSREPRLAWYGALLLALLAAFAVAPAFDARQLDGVNVWIKPAKFALSIAMLAWTTAWFIGHLPLAIRRGRAVDLVVWVLVAAASFELGYIALQAGFGQASHYNETDTLHAVMYALMGMVALILTATQPALAWLLLRHPDPARPPAYRLAVALGLMLTFALGAGAGVTLGQFKPPVGGTTVPLLGWALAGGDLRPAHFLGIHAEQVLPLVGLAVSAAGLRRPRTAVWLVSLAYGVAFAALFAWGLSGRL
ncbi:MAG: hypothetical protein AB7G13_14850 [Lautropia sp.]